MRGGGVQSRLFPLSVSLGVTCEMESEEKKKKRLRLKRELDFLFDFDNAIFLEMQIFVSWPCWMLVLDTVVN